ETTLFREKIAWFPWPDRGLLHVEINGRRADISLRGIKQQALVAAAGVPASSNGQLLPEDVRLQRMLARLPPYVRHFRHAWLFMDRDTQADDNAEHLYRYVRRQHPEINAWFILRETSHDWQRLEDDGFRLLAFGSLAH